MADILRREMAPIADGAWKEIELQSSRILKGNLSGRKLVDFCGPHGWQFAAVNLGRLDVTAGKAVDGVGWGLHQVLPLLELRVPSVWGSGAWTTSSAAPGTRNWSP